MYLCIYCQSVTALTLSVYHFTTAVIAIVLPLSFPLFYYGHYHVVFPFSIDKIQSHTHFPLWKILASITKAAHNMFYSFVKFPCDQNNHFFMPIYLNTAITIVPCVLWCLGTYVTCLGFEHTLNFWFPYTYINIHIADILFSKPCQTQIQFMSKSMTVIPQQRVMCHGGLTEVAKVVGISGKSLLLWLYCMLSHFAMDFFRYQ